MNPVIFNIGNIEIRWYAVLILVGVLLGFLLAIIEGKRKGISKEDILDLGFYVVLFGIIGARLYYVLFNYNAYKGNFLEIFKIWNGGLAIHGGIIVGLLTIIIYALIKKIRILKLTDLAVPSVILAQAIGRWGNFFNSEAHGPATTLASLQALKFIPKYVIKGMNIGGVYYHPTFYYESLWCLCGFVLLIIMRRIFKYIKTGELTCVYVMWYSLGRYFIESLRTDSLMIGSLKAAQVVSIGAFALAFILLIIILIKKDNEEVIEVKKENKKKKNKKNIDKEETKEENNENIENEDLDK